MGTDRMGARECYREVILYNIDYSYLVQDSHIDREQLDEIVDLIVLHQRRIVAVDGGRGVIQRRQKVFLDIADIGGVVLHTVHDILNM